MGGKWIQAAVDKMEKKGTTGSFSRAADKAGMSTQAYAKKELASPKASGKMKKRANFALNAIGAMARKKKREEY